MQFILVYGAIIVGIVLIIMSVGTTDPGEQVNHLHFGKYVIELTFGPLFSLFLAPIIIKGVDYFIDKRMKREEKKREEADRIRLEAIATKEKLDGERHTYLLKELADNRLTYTEHKEAIMAKIEEICERFDKNDRRFYNHGHLLKQKEDGTIETHDIIIKQANTSGI